MFEFVGYLLNLILYFVCMPVQLIAFHNFRTIHNALWWICLCSEYRKERNEL